MNIIFDCDGDDDGSEGSGGKRITVRVCFSV